MTKKFSELSLSHYLEDLSSAEPVPGGGSVSAYVAALGMGLIQMVGRVALGRKPKDGEEKNRETLQKIINATEKIKKDAFQIVDLDPKVYAEVMEAYKHPEKMEDALQNSFRLQADLAFLIIMAREFNQEMSGLIKGSIKNDLLVSMGLLDGAYHGAYHTAMINVQYMKDAAKKAHAEKALEELKRRFEKGKSGGR